MYTEKKLLFLYAVSPVHMGSGTALGVIDNPVQRERHSEHPILAGSGIKGALRDAALKDNGGSLSRQEIDRIFGPETNASEYAGAVSFSDAQLVAFPVRSLKGAFVYATSPLALNRMSRMVAVTRGFVAHWDLPDPGPDGAYILSEDLQNDGHIVLESFQLKVRGKHEGLEKAADWLAETALPSEGFDFFKEKLKKHLVLISDDQLVYFLKNSTSVEPHVRIDDASGTADDGGLFFTENVPPESIFVSLLMASRERGPNGNKMSAEEVVSKLTETLDEKLVQIGGDATTGRGLVTLRIA